MRSAVKSRKDFEEKLIASVSKILMMKINEIIGITNLLV
jgi:hypothetical protein